MKVIKLPSYGIEISLLREDEESISNCYTSGSIKSDLKEVCKFCDDPKCYGECPDAKCYIDDRDWEFMRDKKEEIRKFKQFNITFSIRTFSITFRIITKLTYFF